MATEAWEPDTKGKVQHGTLREKTALIDPSH